MSPFLLQVTHQRVEKGPPEGSTQIIQSVLLEGSEGARRHCKALIEKQAGCMERVSSLTIEEDIYIGELGNLQESQPPIKACLTSVWFRNGHVPIVDV